MAAPHYPTLHSQGHHFGWNNSLSPRVEVNPGDVVELEILESSAGQLSPSSTAGDVRKLDFARVNPLTGPVYVQGAEPGDTLMVEILDFEPGQWGWTAIIPGFGLLADDFPGPYLHISSYDRARVEFTPDIHLPTRPFTGTIGVAPAEKGTHSVVPPRHVGGNMDLRDVMRGTTLYLPVEVPGALFSAGDTHAAQGDGEVCGSAIETAMSVRLRIGLRKDLSIKRPQLDVPRSPTPTEDHDGYRVTTGINPDLMLATKDAVRDMIEHLGREYDLAPELAYCLCSVAVHMRISEVVGAPNWLVSAYLPKSIFR